MKRVGLLGSVNSSKMILESMIDLGYPPVIVGGLDEDMEKRVSGYQPIHKLAQEHNIKWLTFKKVNSREVIDSLMSADLDIIFVIGLSQIVSKELMCCAKEYCVGAHPTALPKYRGRAAIPWLILLGEKESKATLFKLDEGMDSGDIIMQVSYKINTHDYAINVCESADMALIKALRIVLPKMYNGSVQLISQNHDEATYLLARRPENGHINWDDSIENIHTLIRAASNPYPGAYTYYHNEKVIIWKANIIKNNKYIGKNGQIANIDETGKISVVTSNGLLVIEDYELTNNSLCFVEGKQFK